MDVLRCPFCNRRVGDDPRAKYCSAKCRWRSHWQRAVRSAVHIEELPPATLPADAEAILPVSGERSAVMLQLAVLGYAPAGARGYRVGIKHGFSKIQRWFPIARYSDVPMFLLEPFERPLVPVPGLYAVAYLDATCRPLGEPRFTVGIEEIDSRVLYSDGDRTYKPRPRR